MCIRDRKTAFAKAFAPIAALFAGTAAVDSMTDDASVAQETRLSPAEAVIAQEIASPVVVAKTLTVHDVATENIATNVLQVKNVAPVAISFADKARSLALLAGTNLKTFGSSVKANSWDKNLGYFKHDGKVATTAAVAAVAGLTYATYKAYKNGSLNPFGKAAIVAEQAPVVEEVAPVVQEVKALEVLTKRTTRNHIRHN